MTKDRIIESLEYCRKNQLSNDCEDCEYGGRSFQICERLVDDVLVLLKDQETIKIDVKKINDSGRCGRCPNCLIELNETDYPNYCGYCGQKVKWE